MVVGDCCARVMVVLLVCGEKCLRVPTCSALKMRVVLLYRVDKVGQRIPLPVL